MTISLLQIFQLSIFKQDQQRTVKMPIKFKFPVIHAFFSSQHQNCQDFTPKIATNQLIFIKTSVVEFFFFEPKLIKYKFATNKLKEMSNTGNSSKRTKTQKEIISPSKLKSESRLNKLKQIDAIYKQQMQQIHNTQSPSFAEKKTIEEKNDKNTQVNRRAAEIQNKTIKIGAMKIDDVQNISVSSRALQSVVSEDKVKYSKYLAPETTRTTDLLKLQNENKDNKIRDLTNKCEYLLEKLRNHISANEFSQQLESLNRLVENKIQRFENLFKIKNQQTFFKNKLQVISLLQQFEIPKQEINQINEIQTESSLFTFLAKKIKTQLKTFRHRDQENKFQIHKDKILSDKLEERLTYLTETNELLKISQQKLKQKNDSLKGQMHEFLQKMRQKQTVLQQKQSQLFRVKRQTQQILSSASKVQQLQKRYKQQMQGMNQRFELKQKEYKNLLSTQSIQKKRLEGDLQEKDCLIEEMGIREKYLTQENERINRELLRSKERYEWCQKQLENKRREFQQEKTAMLDDFRKYKQTNNESLVLYAKAQTDQAIRKVHQYQQSYSRIAFQLQEQRKTSQLKYQQYLSKLQSVQQTWIDKTKRLQQIRQEQLQQISKDYEDKHQQLRKQFQKKQKLLADEMQAKMKTILAQKDKKFTQKLIHLQQQNQSLKLQINNNRQFSSILETNK